MRPARSWAHHATKRLCHQALRQEVPTHVPESTTAMSLYLRRASDACSPSPPSRLLFVSHPSPAKVPPVGRVGAMNSGRSHSARVMVGDGARITAAITAMAASAAPLAVVTTAALRHLVHELGSHERAVRFLARTA